jgi:hypothetical protein
VRRISGSAPRLPIKITLLTLPAMTLLRSFPISPIAGFQPSAGPGRGKGDRRKMAVIHTASRRAACSNACSYFVLTVKASETAKYQVAPASRHASPQGESRAPLLPGNTI